MTKLKPKSTPKLKPKSTPKLKPKPRVRNPWANYVPPARNGPCVEEQLSGVHLPKAMPAYGCRPFAKTTACMDIHPGGPIPFGSEIYCECCSKWGCDHLLKRLPSLPPNDAATTYETPADGLKGGKS